MTSNDSTDQLTFNVQEYAEEDYGLMVAVPDPTGQVGAIFDIFQRFDPTEFETYRQAAERLEEASRGSLKVYAEHAFRNLEEALAQTKRFNESHDVGLRSIIEISPDLLVGFTCYILTFCTALHLYQEQSCNQAKRLYGKSSIEFEQVDTEFSRAYDARLAYRLIYRLRNVLVHYSPKCVDVVFSSKEERSPRGVILYEHLVHIKLIRETVINTRKGLSAAIRHELAALNEDPDLINLCREALEELNSVHRKIFRLLHPELSEDLRLITKLNELFEGRNGDRSLVRISDIRRPRPKMQYIPLRQELFDYAREVSTPKEN